MHRIADNGLFVQGRQPTIGRLLLTTTKAEERSGVFDGAVDTDPRVDGVKRRPQLRRATRRRVGNFQTTRNFLVCCIVPRPSQCSAQLRRVCSTKTGEQCDS